MELKWKLHTYDFKPTSYTTSETGATARVIMGVREGTWVRGVMLRVGEAFDGTTPQITIGDDDDAAGLMTWSEANITSAGLKNGGGPELITQPSEGLGGTNGKLYAADDTIDLEYTAADDTTEGLCTVYIVYAEIE